MPLFISQIDFRHSPTAPAEVQGYSLGLFKSHRVTHYVQPVNGLKAYDLYSENNPAGMGKTFREHHTFVNASDNEVELHVYYEEIPFRLFQLRCFVTQSPPTEKPLGHLYVVHHVCQQTGAIPFQLLQTPVTKTEVIPIHHPFVELDWSHSSHHSYLAS